MSKETKASTQKSKPEPPETLNSTMRKLCEMMADPEFKMLSKTDMAKELKISRPTLYSYQERLDVRIYVRGLIDYYSDEELGNVWKSLVKACKKGNVNAMRLYFEMKQMYVPPAQVSELHLKDANAQINIISNIPRPIIEQEVDQEDD